MVGRIRVI
ncbi:unnamed protein product [Linum tenue]|uniref:Uncharacterized protein n=1 Tax=Linum tenue TaxID=586396 RepID=A0AAV0IH21_9ROSI|nr:unnamed protein product [Linum tenue]